MTDRRGMTLLELVVGLTITAAALTAGYGALASMVDHRGRALAAADSIARAATVRRDLVKWIAGARLVPGSGGAPFRGLDGIRDDLPNDELSFLTRAPTPLGRGEVAVRIHLDQDEKTPERGLLVEFMAWHGTETYRIELEPRAAGLDFRYFSRIMGDEGWQPSWISSTLLPAGVEMTLLPAPGDTLAPLLSLPIVVPFGAGR